MARSVLVVLTVQGDLRDDPIELEPRLKATSHQ